MSKLHRSVILLCAAAFVAGVRGQDASIAPQEMQEQWVGNTLLGKTANGGTVRLTLRRDGSAELAGAVSDTGTWRLSESGYCTTWKTIRVGQERCFTARRSGTGITVLNPDGSVSGTFLEIK